MATIVSPATPAASKEAVVQSPERSRIPMNVPVRKLEVPEIPGYRLYWFRNEQGRLMRARSAGYEFVQDHEVALNAFGMGSETADSGNQDMGSNVSIVAADRPGADGQLVRLILMKIKQELHNEDVRLYEENVTDKIAASLYGGRIGQEHEKGDDAVHRYVDKARTNVGDFFKPKRKR